MRCFTVSRKQISNGLEIIDNQKLGKVLFLGEQGRGRKYDNVSLSRKCPPAIVEGSKVLEAEVEKVKLTKPKEFTFYTLKASSRQDSRILVRINTCGCYTKNTTGRWEVLIGNATLVTEGWGAEGIAGNCGSWKDSLVIVEEGAAIKVKPHGGSKTPAYVLFYGSKAEVPKILTEEEFAVMIADESAEVETL